MDLQWFPGKAEQLITWAQDISLYRVQSSEETTSELKSPQSMSMQVQLTPAKTATLLSKVSELQYPKVVDAYPGTDAEGMIAVGMNDGRVALTSFGATIISKEFVPKHQRQVNALSWNKYSPNFLAAGLDKARSDHAVAIWDVAASSKFVNGFHSDALRPANELGNSETAHSVAWVAAKSLLVGMNGKHIKLFDLRDSQAKLERTASTKAVYGLTVDNHMVASFADNQAYVWDMRNFEKPFVVLNHSKPIIKVGWCPTRIGLLACLEKDSPSIQLHDVHHAVQSSEDGEPAVLERRLTPAYPPPVSSYQSQAVPLASFAWHPTEQNLLTTVTMTGVLWNSVVFERITLNWSPTSKLGWSNGKKIIQYIDNTDMVYSTLDDISVKMKQRAVSGYGLKSVIKENAKFVEDDDMLKNLWLWLEFCRQLAEKEKFQVTSLTNCRFPGVQTVLRMDASSGMSTPTMKSEVVHNNSFDLHNGKTYRSEERAFVQQLCGWSLDSTTGSNSPTRRAAIALFHLRLRQAIRILSDSGNSIVAMAISGFSDQKNSLWRELAQTNCMNLEDPYIRAVFSFLTEQDFNYESILNEQGLSVADRVGFACSFLPDGKLISFIQELTSEMNKKGNLDGILLTGMTIHALPLLQRYLDMTGDVQTISLLAIQTMANEIPTSSLLTFWIERYRELLNSWKLWEPRAEFDIIKNRNNPALIPQPEVTVSCNFCGKNISPAGLGGGLSRTGGTQLFSRFTTTNAKIKLSCCPSCRKPLPRCAICLLHMGTVLGTAPGGTEPVVKELPQHTGASVEALSWYTWCQSCRHGGHSVHLNKWFLHQLECPVTTCTCKCNTLDKVIEFPN